ncbi:MAG: hypothetical protein BA874_10835 [Desulfuromonadales bacterium C00003068]|nr:MAG: hypothetical protein BA874_10835 [Desulfuromonadales bacterium C00003068]
MRVLFERGTFYYIVCEVGFRTQYVVAVNAVNVRIVVLDLLCNEMELPKPKQGGSFRKIWKIFVM